MKKEKNKFEVMVNMIKRLPKKDRKEAVLEMIKLMRDEAQIKADENKIIETATRKVPVQMIEVKDE